MKRAVLVFVLVIGCGTGSAPVSQPSFFVPSASPGWTDTCHTSAQEFCVLNPDVTQATIGETICVPGWTATIRPPSSYTSALKIKQIAAEGLADTNPSDYEEDHRMPLELGGAPSDPLNLSPESHSGSYLKDADEDSFKFGICRGTWTLTQAQTMFVARWLGPYPEYK